MKNLFLDLFYVSTILKREQRLMLALKLTFLPIVFAILTYLASLFFPAFIISKLGFGLIAALLTVISLLWVVLKRIRELEQPSLKISCRGDIAGCVQATRFQNGRQTTYLRLLVENTSARPIHNCQAHLIGMEKEGAVFQYGERTELIWSGTNSSTVDIQGFSDKFLDIICLYERGSGGGVTTGNLDETIASIIENAGARLAIANELFSVSEFHKFRDPANYTLKIRFSNDEGISLIKNISFTYTGEVETAAMVCD